MLLDEALLTPREVAEILGVSTTTIGRWARTGELETAAHTPGGQRRYRRSDVDAMAGREGTQWS